MPDYGLSSYKEAAKIRYGLLGQLLRTKVAEDLRRESPAEISRVKILEEQLAEIENERDERKKEQKKLQLLKDGIKSYPDIPKEDIPIIDAFNNPADLIKYWEEIKQYTGMSPEEKKRAKLYKYGLTSRPEQEKTDVEKKIEQLNITSRELDIKAKQEGLKKEPIKVTPDIYNKINSKVVSYVTEGRDLELDQSLTKEERITINNLTNKMIKAYRKGMPFEDVLNILYQENEQETGIQAITGAAPRINSGNSLIIPFK